MIAEKHGGSGSLKQLALRDWHERAGARFAPFAGWEMPLQYAGIVAEHTAVRTAAGMFDISHMGRIRVDGPEAGDAIRSVTSYDTGRIRPGRAHYTLACTDDGGIADDAFVYRVTEAQWLVVHNAANAELGMSRLAAAAGAGATDVTPSTVMLAVQGPAAREALRQVLGEGVDALRPRRCVELDWHGGTVLAARTGYTGEDGAECIVEARMGGELWDALLARGVVPAGLGARDTLRLEAALPLHGHDIDSTTNPFEAGLGWAVSLDDGQPFTGRDALQRLNVEPPRRQLGHLRLVERGVARAGYSVLGREGSDDEPVATLTSGVFSPTLRTGIGMAYLPVALAVPGTRLAVDIRGRAVPAAVVPRPFYRRAS